MPMRPEDEELLHQDVSGAPGYETPGLAGFDAAAAANNLANVGRQPVPEAAPAAAPAPAPLASVGPGPAVPPGADPNAVPPPPSAPPAPTTPPPAPGTQGAVAAALGSEQQAHEAANAAELAAAEGQAPAVHAQSDAAEANKKADDEYQASVKKIQEEHNAADAVTRRQLAATEQAIKNYKIHDYFQGKSVLVRIGTALASAMGAFGAALAHTPNYAMDVIKDNIDRDHQLQVEGLNKLKDQEVMQRTGLSDSNAARARATADLTLLDAAKRRQIAGVLGTAIAKSNDDNFKKSAEVLRTKLTEEAAQSQAKAQQLLFQNNLAAQHARDQHTLTEAQAAHLRRAGGPSSKQVAAEEKAIYGEADKDEARLRGTSARPGVIQRMEAASAVADELREAAKSGDPGRIKVAVMHAKEQSTRFLTGAAPTKQTMQMNEDLAGSPAEFEAKLSRLMGNPTEGKQYVDNMIRNIEGITEQQRQVVDQERAGLVRKYHGDNGMARTPTMKRAAQGRLEALFGAVKNSDGTPRYQEGGGQAGTTQPSAPPAPDGRRVKLKDGRTGTLMPDSTFVPDK